jgi:hypothetical protein
MCNRIRRYGRPSQPILLCTAIHISQIGRAICAMIRITWRRPLTLCVRVRIAYNALLGIEKGTAETVPLRFRSTRTKVGGPASRLANPT